MLWAVAKNLAFRTGAMNLLHRVQNRECLTVVMFHRVLPALEQLRLGADSEYTVTPELLAACAAFLRRNYTIVDLDDVLQSHRGIKPLPPWPVLITFDDGWADNLEWASPVLRGIPWTLFVATDAISGPQIWWQEVLLWALRSGHATNDELYRIIEAEGGMPTGGNDADTAELQLLLRYGAMRVGHRGKTLAGFEQLLSMDRDGSHMLSASQLAELSNAGVAIGAHGKAHLPLTCISEPEADMRQARDWLTRELGDASSPAMSFPHGRWNARVAKAALGLGYELLFTSDAVLNRCPGGWLQSAVVGRLPISTRAITGLGGQLVPPRMAGWLYRRDRKVIEA